MSKSMRNEMIDAVRKNCEGNLQLHKTNIEIYLNKSVGIGEHSELPSEIYKWGDRLASAQDSLLALERYAGRKE